MAINPLVNYQQVLSMALEDRSNGYQDLVSNVIPLLGLMKKKGLIKDYSGPRIREALIEDVVTTYMDIAETTLMETIETALYSDGTANNGKQLTGLAAAVPIV